MADPQLCSSKIVLCTLSGLFIGFSFFRADTSQQGLQNQMFSLFMLMTIFGNLVQQSKSPSCLFTTLYPEFR